MQRSGGGGEKKKGQTSIENSRVVHDRERGRTDGWMDGKDGFASLAETLGKRKAEDIDRE